MKRYTGLVFDDTLPPASCRLLSVEELDMQPNSAEQACQPYTNCELALSIKTLLEASSQSPIPTSTPHLYHKVYVYMPPCLSVVLSLIWLPPASSNIG